MFEFTISGVALAGLLSFLSPCILPMVPFYLSYLGGVSAHDVAGGTERAGPRVILAASLFAAGVITVFVGLGASASAFGQALREWFDVLRWIAAGVIALMGLQFLGVFRLGLLNRQLRADAPTSQSLGGAYLMGLAFAFGWTPCVGPMLTMILITAGATETAQQGMMLLLVYGIGMTAPFVLAAAFTGPFMRLMVGIRPHLGLIERIMGGMLILFAVLIATNALGLIAQWLLENFAIFRRIG